MKTKQQTSLYFIKRHLLFKCNNVKNFIIYCIKSTWLKFTEKVSMLNKTMQYCHGSHEGETDLKRRGIYIVIILVHCNIPII